MRPIISAFLFVFVSFVCAAQNDRALNGIVYGENGGPLTGATVYAVGTDLSAKTDTAGRFALAVPHFVEELRALSADELNAKLKDLKEELFNLRFQHAINQLDNPQKIVEVKKNIARVMTVLSEKNA